MMRKPEPASGMRHGVRAADAAPRAIEPASRGASGMLLVGAAARDAGKTEFACGVLRRWSSRHALYGIKVTTVHEPGEPCPRGAASCGVCGELSAPFELLEERGDAPPDKDTRRLLDAGARRVLWLRAHQAALPAAAAALLEHIGPGALCVCESNALRELVEPDLFLMLRRRGASASKRSAAAVAALADADVLSDGETFAPSCDELQIVDGRRWALRLPATLIVLAGGRSTRMGQDKSLLPLDDSTLLEHVIRRLEPYFAEVLVSTGDERRYPFLAQRCIPDRQPDQGPMMGIASALAAATHELSLVVACDMPDVPLPLALRLLRAARGADGAVPISADGWPQPLFAVYRRATAARMDAALGAGERRIARIFGELDLRYVPLAGGAGVDNLNTPQDYRSWLARR